MSSIIEQRLKTYNPISSEEEEDALKEILQEIILNALSDAKFFEQAIFQGGTALRIFHQLNRFSEDLDFILRNSSPDFRWQPFLSSIEDACKRYGIEPEILDKSKASSNVQKMFLKDSSIGKLINLSFHHHSEKKLMIKLEIDTNPPLGSITEIKFLDFPLACPVVLQDLSSNFSGKCHALLCRKYVKGRDWYDFLWYVSNGIIPNFTFLENAIHQTGPWSKQTPDVTPPWLLAALENKIKSLEWKEVVNDVEPFLKINDKKTLKLWSLEFFLDRIEKLNRILLRQA